MREKAEDPYVSLGICSRCHKGILGTQYKMCAECREKKAKVEAKRLARETPEQAEAMAKISDGAIVGSAIVKIVAKYGKNCIPYVKEYVQSMKQAVERA